MSVITLGEIVAEVTLKDVKNVHLSVYPPTGTVRVSAPRYMDLDTVRVYVLSKLGWIRKQRVRLAGQDRETPREYVDRESHYLWGKRHLLRVVEADAPALVISERGRLVLRVRPDTDIDARSAILERFYRETLREEAAEWLAEWAGRMEVIPHRMYVRRMKTRWGSCTPATGTIRLNTELAKKPRECGKYVLVHELAHLIEPTHNARFIAILDHHLPMWRELKAELNRLPVRHESWKY